MADKKDVRISPPPTARNDIQVILFIHNCCHHVHNILSQLCQNLTSEDVAKTFKTNKQMDKNAAKLEGEIDNDQKWVEDVRGV